MTINDRLDIVKKNYKNVKAGTIYSTRSKIYKDLGLPAEKGNKQNKKITEFIFAIESTNNPKKKNEVKVIGRKKYKIDDLVYKDGRIRNGGAHNNKYEKICRNALAVRLKSYPSMFLSYNTIFTDIYGFEKDALKHEPKRNNALVRYVQELRRILIGSTNKALDNLSPGYLDYEKVYQVIGFSHSWPDFLLNDDELLTEFIYEMNDISKPYDIFEAEIDKILKSKIDVKSFKWIDYVFSDAIDIDEISRQIKDYMCTYIWGGNPAACLSRTPSGIENKAIESIEDFVVTKLGIKKEMKNNVFFKEEIRKREYRIYNLLGWNRVWRTLFIDYKREEIGKEYTERTEAETFELLKEQLEPKMRNWAARCKNTADIKKPEYLAKWEIPMYENSMAFGKAVSHLHCKIFKLVDDENYILKSNENIAWGITYDGKTIEEIRAEYDDKIAKGEIPLDGFKPVSVSASAMDAHFDDDADYDDFPF